MRQKRAMAGLALAVGLMAGAAGVQTAGGQTTGGTGADAAPAAPAASPEAMAPAAGEAATAPTASPAAGDDTNTAPPAYRDDRSGPEAVIASLYNAVNRHELVRAYSYWQGAAQLIPYPAFAKGYAETAHVALTMGKPRSEGAAGSVYFTVPVAIRSTDTSGAAKVYAGCYTLRQVDPGVQDTPPFDPIHIEKGELQPASGPLESALPAHCAE